MKAERGSRKLITLSTVPGSHDNSSCVVGGAHALVLRISSIFGLAPLRFESYGNGFIVTVSTSMCVYSYCLITVLVICTIAGLVAEINLGIELSVRMTSHMSQVVSACDVLVILVIAGAGVCGAPRRMRKMMKIMNRVATIDKSLGTEYSVVSERKLIRKLLLLLLFFSVLVGDDFSFYAMQGNAVERIEDIVYNYIGFYLLYYIVMILELQFAITVLFINRRLKAINDALADTARHISAPVKNVTEQSPLNIFAVRVTPASGGASNSVCELVDSLSGGQKSSIIIRKTAKEGHRLLVPPCEAVRRLASLHGAFCNVVHRVDASYNLPIVVILLSTLFHLIVTPYFLILEISISTNRIHFLILQFLWCATHVLRMFVVVEPCHYTINEGKRTEDLVSQLNAYAPSNGVLPSRLELFSRQLLQRSVSYNPLGMCTLDRPLIASIIGAVSTYLVILIQFQRYDGK